jgi:hypothetical protein
MRYCFSAQTPLSCFFASEAKCLSTQDLTASKLVSISGSAFPSYYDVISHQLLIFILGHDLCSNHTMLSSYSEDEEASNAR